VVPVILHSSFILRASAARLRSETTLPIKWMAARVQIGTAKGAKSVLPHLAQSQDQRKTASALEPCAQLEFQSDPFPGPLKSGRRRNLSKPTSAPHGLAPPKTNPRKPTSDSLKHANAMVTPRETFQTLLRELFQFDLADLDFGIYRLFRLKKDELDKFINEQIP
jgi:hypothetical protein